MKKVFTLFRCLILFWSCTSPEEDKGKNTAYDAIQKNEREYIQDSLYFSGRFVDDSVLLRLFWEGNFNKILEYKEAHLSRLGKDIIVIALVKEDMEFLEKNMEKYLPEILALNVVVGKESFDDLWEDEKFIEPMAVYKKYAIYLYLSKRYSVPINFIDKFMRWFRTENPNYDPIIHNELLFIVSKISEVKEPKGYVAEYLNYTDSLMLVYPENYHIKYRMAEVLLDLEEYDKALKIYKENFWETRELDFLFGILNYYQNHQPDRDSLERYERILDKHPDYNSSTGISI